jgi:nickel superoxide dismutase
MLNKIKETLINLTPVKTAEAHCDGPCGVYDPAQARIEAESVYMLTKKILDLKHPGGDDTEAHAKYQNTLTRFIAIKEERADLAKHHVLVLWTDYFKPEHLDKYPNLHELFWKTTKLCSSCKQEISLEHAQELLDNIKQIHEIFWETKGKDVEWYLASQ